VVVVVMFDVGFFNCRYILCAPPKLLDAARANESGRR
jgi:hypothetical protein